MIRLSQNEALKDRHTFGVSTYARYFLETDNLTELFDFKRSEKDIWTSPLIIGEGSNLLFKTDYPGFVLHPISSGIEIVEKGDNHVILEVGAGENWDKLVEWSVNKRFAGLENLSHIPGSAGAAPVQNIGAYGAEAKNFIQEVLVADLNKNTSSWMSTDQCGFGYRSSVFKKIENANWLVWKVRFKLYLDERINLNYQGLKHQLKDIQSPGITDVRKAVINLRESKLPNPTKIGNAGSFFKNPFVTIGQAEEIKTVFPNMPVYSCESKDKVKLAAGWLIEQTELKGYRKGDAGTSPNQALVIVNHGEATGQQLADVAQFIQVEVKKKFNIHLEPEVRII